MQLTPERYVLAARLSASENISRGRRRRRRLGRVA